MSHGQRGKGSSKILDYHRLSCWEKVVQSAKLGSEEEVQISHDVKISFPFRLPLPKVWEGYLFIYLFIQLFGGRTDQQNCKVFEEYNVMI